MGRNQTGGLAATDYIVDKTKNLQVSDVATVVRYVHAKMNGVGKPTIDVDASIYFYKFKDANNGPIKELVALLVAWAANQIAKIWLCRRMSTSFSVPKSRVLVHWNRLCLTYHRVICSKIETEDNAFGYRLDIVTILTR